MQIDFHHAVTYILARLAGFPHPDAAIVAHAAQYVDDANNQGTIRFTNGSTYDHIASAHAVCDLDHNCKNTADYSIWVPFHFLPGNNGQPAGKGTELPLAERMLCQPDSPLANRMFEECRATKNDPNALHRLGITCHVYEDTFAHQRFAGFRHNINDVSKIDAILPNNDSLFDKLGAMVADLLKLGHGGAGVNPDMPFLNWQYHDGFHQQVPRDNPTTFLAACDRLFAQFHYYLGTDPGTGIPAADRKAMGEMALSIQLKNGDKRHAAWIKAIADGSFSFGKPTADQMNSLAYLAKGEGSWKYIALGTKSDLDSPLDRFVRPAGFESTDWYKFHQALKAHRSTVLDVLLPEFGLPPSYAAAQAAGIDK